MASCQGPNCGAEIVFAESHGGRQQPFDREPNPEGNRVLLGRGPNRLPLAIPREWVDGSAAMADAKIDEATYMPHHATCPDASSFRS